MKLLHVLIVEDCESDAEFMVRALKKGGYEVHSERVESETTFEDALSSNKDWNVVISDFSLPGFSADSALKILKKSGRDLPFIIVSNNIGEEAAVAMMKAGAHDYVMKASISRLAPAVERELRDAAIRTDRLRILIALEESEARWKLALDGSSYGVWDWNIPDGRILYSSCWMLMHGFEIQDMRCNIEHHKTLIHPDDLQRVGESWNQCINSSVSHYQIEFRSKDLDGTWRWVLNRGMVVVRGTDGIAIRMISTQADISMRKQNEQLLVELNGDLERKFDERTAELTAALDQLAESKKLASLGALVTGIAHELNTPLGNIVLGVSTISDQLEILSEQVKSERISRTGLQSQLMQWRNAALLALRNSNRAVDLIDRFKQVATDQVSHSKRPINLSELIRSCVAATVNLRSEVNVRCNMNLDRSIILNGSPGHLEQVIANVLINAVHHAFEERLSGTIDIEAQCADGKVFVSIADDGIGIPIELCQRVFDPFFTTKLGNGNMGLGLTIVHNLVTGILKGKITIKNRDSGGVMVEINFPYEQGSTP